jgi:hypothetical protein
MSAATAPRTCVAILLPKGQVVAEAFCLRDCVDRLTELDQRRLALALRELAERYAPRTPRPIA